MTSQNQAQMGQALLAEQDKIYDRTYQTGRDKVTDAYNVAGLTGYYNGGKTLQSQQMDTGNAQWNQQFEFNKNQANVSNQQWDKQFNAGLEQWNKQFDYQVGKDKKLDEQWNKSFAADQANAAAGRAIQWAGVALDREKFEESKKTMVSDATDLSPQATEIYKNALDKIGSLTKYTDEYGNVLEKPASTPEEVFLFIDNSSLSDEEKLMIIERIPGIKKKK
jgi:hypothetical protein